MMYSDKVMEHFYSPRNVGILGDANGIGEAGDPNCGDIMKIYIKVENNIIKSVKFKAFGCGSAIASSSIATELIKGKTTDEAWKLTNKSVIEALEGLPTSKVHCSVLAEQTIHNAINNYRESQKLELWKDNLK
ncbi:Fe-S cluster assembly scaffold protein NifU [Clostridium estertheticum]|uniref:Fe-S cluster assembly scaffold protein NifU n=1 Tax=Clostridium estertheticum TaxID=238834 RepID=UPI0013E98D03|nr:Fe-S cluster assembly scaffold protein NifU [Clostridium estertheticum]MBZ9687821.1 Fe-S cluster assembly scaffold protein NifU [Clostridium estertheticum]